MVYALSKIGDVVINVLLVARSVIVLAYLWSAGFAAKSYVRGPLIILTLDSCIQIVKACACSFFAVAFVTVVVVTNSNTNSDHDK